MNREIGIRKVGQIRRPTNCVQLRSLEANKWRSVFRGSRELVVQRAQLPQRVHRIARRGSANELEATVPRFNGMFEINFIAGCGFALELLWYAGERQLPNKISEKREIIAHIRSLHGIQTGCPW